MGKTRGVFKDIVRQREVALDAGDSPASIIVARIMTVARHMPFAREILRRVTLDGEPVKRADAMVPGNVKAKNKRCGLNLSRFARQGPRDEEAE